MLAYKISQINRILESDKSDERKLDFIKSIFPKPEEFPFISMIETNLEYARKSGKTKFRLLTTLNDNLMLFAWCNVQYNFIGIINNPDYLNPDKDYTIDYSIDELEEVMKNAEQWLKSCKESPNSSGAPYLISNLQIMAI